MIKEIPNSGIYCIKNLTNNKVYVGKTLRLNRRYSEHRGNLNNNRNDPNKHLQNSWNKYGERNFKFELLEYVNNLNVLGDKENWWIKELKANDRRFGYNKRKDKI